MRKLQLKLKYGQLKIVEVYEYLDKQGDEQTDYSYGPDLVCVSTWSTGTFYSVDDATENWRENYAQFLAEGAKANPDLELIEVLISPKSSSRYRGSDFLLWKPGCSPDMDPVETPQKEWEVGRYPAWQQKLFSPQGC